MAIDSQVQTLLDAAARAARTPVNKLAPVEARVQFKELRKALLPPTPEIGSVVDSTVSGRRGTIPVRHYRPLRKASSDVLPVLIYFHGGGWVVGDLDTHDTLCRQLANAGECAVISVDYRMGPEQNFPPRSMMRKMLCAMSPPAVRSLKSMSRASRSAATAPAVTSRPWLR